MKVSKIQTEKETDRDREPKRRGGKERKENGK